MNACPVCSSGMIGGLTAWHFVCSACSYEGSTLEPVIQDRPAAMAIDEAAREEGLKTIRQENFKTLSKKIAKMVKTESRPRMLDVGCAHGWFIELNQAAYDVVGIEPDIAVAEATKDRGIPTRMGFFPDVLADGERFDVIVFNDVLEHIPDINGVLSACHKHLNDDGIVVVNAPSRRGILYKIAGLMARFRMAGSFDRLWQKGLPSPHVHYLDSASTSSLARRNGFTLEDEIPLPSVVVKGLFDRIHCAGQTSVAKAALLTAAITAAYPLFRILPSDIEVWFLRKRREPAMPTAAA